MGRKLSIDGVVFMGENDISSWEPLPSGGTIVVASSLFSFNTFSGFSSDFCNKPNIVDGTIHKPSLLSLSGISNGVGEYKLAQGFLLTTDYGGLSATGGMIVNIRKFHKYGCHLSEASVNKGAFRSTGRFWLNYQSNSCGLMINYVDGKSAPMLEFPQCPQEVFLVEDEICQNACNLANSIINKLG